MMQQKSKIYNSFQAFSQTYQFDFTDKDSKLGNGSYGEVIMGENIQQESDNQLPERRVAIKRSFSENDGSIEREYEAAKDLSHPNVMRYLAYGRLTAPHVGARDYLVMPYHPDGNLHHFIRYNTLTTIQTRSLVKGILEGLACLHHHKRQHRDLKGSNILVGRDPKTNETLPVIADFGSAKLVTQSNSESFSQSEHAKTIANAAPEQILGESLVNYNVDLWAFGVILYEIMTGQHPFNYGLDELEPTTARNTLTKRIVNATLPEKTEKIAEPYQTMIRRCLVVDRKKRVQKAEELLKVLDTYKFHEPGTDPVEVVTAVERSKKNGWRWALPGIFGLVLLILFIINLPKSLRMANDSLALDLTTVASDTVTPASSFNSPLNEFFGPEMVYVKGGTFQMGSNEGDDVDKPVHQVRVNDFMLGKYEVTVIEYMEFVEATKSHYPEWLDAQSVFYIGSGKHNPYKDFGYGNRELWKELPIVGVRWIDAEAYCEWLSKKTGQVYRLPTEAEWEYAAGGGSEKRTRFGNGKDFLKADEANFDAKASGKTFYSEKGEVRNRPIGVGNFAPNRLGLYDMVGNVNEWCSDSWSMGDRPIRGGSWQDDPTYCRAASRGTGMAQDFCTDYVGFRVLSQVQ